MKIVFSVIDQFPRVERKKLPLVDQETYPIIINFFPLSIQQGDRIINKTLNLTLDFIAEPGNRRGMCGLYLK